MIWVKTEAGRAEMRSRALVKERAPRNLLLMIDGVKSEAMLLGAIAGIEAADFTRLEALGLIAPLGRRPAAPPPAPLTTVDVPVDADEPPPPAPAASAPAGLDYAAYTAALTGLISKELGLRGFRLMLALEKASTIEELRAVGERVIAQIGERRGEAAADAARRALDGR